MFTVYYLNAIVICAETWAEFAALIINVSHLCIFIMQCKNHYTHMVLSCAGLLYDALLVYKAILLIVDMQALLSSFDLKIQPYLNEPKLEPFVSLVQYQGHSYQDG